MPRSAQRWLFPTLAGYQRSWLARDVLAGLSAGAVVVPQAMAYATIANLPVQVGLATCIVPMTVYAALGGSRAMSVSTTSTIATLTATTLVAAGVTSDSGDVPRDLITLTLLVGVILAAARALRLGSLVEVINKPTLLGIQIGVGATVAVGQLPKLLGEEVGPTGEGFLRSLAAVVEALPEAHLATVVLSVCSVTTLLVAKRTAPALPAPLLVVAAAIALSAPGWLPDAGVALVEPVPGGLPLPSLPSLDDVGALVPGACAIAVMAFLESAAVARALRDPGEPATDADRELLATAGANLAGGWFQTLPAAGGFSQSAVSKGAGARSQAAALVTVALALLVALFLAPVVSQLPQATLAALVFVAVLGLLDVRALVRIWRISRLDGVVAVATALVGLTAGLLPAVGVGVVLTLLLVLHGLNRPRLRVGPQEGGVVRVELLAPLYTANVLSTEQAVLDAVEQVPGVEAVVLDVRVLQETSVTVLDTLADLDRELAGRGIELRLAEVPEGARRIAERTSWFRDLVAAGRVRSG